MRTRLLLLVLAAVSLAAVFSTRVSRKMPDFEVYYTAGTRAAVGAPLYRASDGHYQFKYLPAFAVLISPLSRMPLPAAKGAWFSLSGVLMILLLWLSVRGLPSVRTPPALLLILTFAAMAKFYAHELVLGQVNLLFAVLVAGAVVWLERGREVPAGVALALAVVVKPYGILFAPWLAARRTRTAFVVMLSGLVMCLLIPAIRYGWSGNLHLLREWLRTVTSTTAPNILNQDNVSLTAMFSRWLGPDSSAPILASMLGLALLALAAVVVAGRGTLERSEALEAGLILLLIPLLSPQGWDYVLLIATPAVMLLIDARAALPRTLRIAALGAVAVVAAAIYDVLGHDGYAAFMSLSIVTICALVEYAGLVTLRFRRAA
jgi:hypothetical protein